MELQTRIEKLETSLNRQKIAIIALAGVIVAGVGIAAIQPAVDATFGTITCKVWNVVDEDGKVRISAATDADGKASVRWTDKDGKSCGEVTPTAVQSAGGFCKPVSYDQVAKASDGLQQSERVRPIEAKTIPAYDAPSQNIVTGCFDSRVPYSDIPPTTPYTPIVMAADAPFNSSEQIHTPIVMAADAPFNSSEQIPFDVNSRFAFPIEASAPPAIMTSASPRSPFNGGEVCPVATVRVDCPNCGATILIPERVNEARPTR